MTPEQVAIIAINGFIEKKRKDNPRQMEPGFYMPG